MCVCSVFRVQSLLHTYFQTSLNRFLNDLQLTAKKCHNLLLLHFPVCFPRGLLLKGVKPQVAVVEVGD